MKLHKIERTILDLTNRLTEMERDILKRQDKAGDIRNELQHLEIQKTRLMREVDAQ